VSLYDGFSQLQQLNLLFFEEKEPTRWSGSRWKHKSRILWD